MTTPSKAPKRIYKIRSRNGKKVIWVAARSKNQALRWVMEEYFVTELATHEDLLEQCKTEGSEITDVSDPDQADIDDEKEPPAHEQDPKEWGNVQTGAAHEGASE